MTDALFSSAPDSLLLYGICRADASLASELDTLLDAVEAHRDTAGVHGQPVAVVDSGPFSVIVSPLDSAEALRRPSTDDALAHKTVVDAVFARHTVIPVRFGTVVDDRESLDALIHDRAADYRDTLDRIDGHAEMGVRLTLTPERKTATAPADSAYRADRPGTAYLLARQQRQDVQQGRRRRAARAYRTALTDWTAQTSVSYAGDEDTVSVAFLVRSADTAAFREAVADVDAPGVASAEVVGPWAPWSFVG